MTGSNATTYDEQPNLGDQDTRFFRRFSLVILIFVILAFGSKALFNTQDLPPITIMHHFHAVTMGAWFALIALQATLIHRNKTDIHRLLGRLSPVLVVAFIIFAVIISKGHWARIGDPEVITGNLLSVMLFLGFYTAAIIKRGDPDTHKRFMIFATLSVIAPAVGRIPEFLDVDKVVGAPIIIAFHLTPLTYERFFRSKIHGATKVGTLLLILLIPSILILNEVPGWISILEMIAGERGSIA